MTGQKTFPRFPDFGQIRVGAVIVGHELAVAVLILAELVGQLDVAGR